MSLLRLVTFAAAILALTAFTGCELITADNLAPSRSAPPPRPKQEAQGGLTVLVDLPNQPTAARVLADIAAFAQQRGFVLKSPASADNAGAAPQQYQSGKIRLDVSYSQSDLRVVATLHSASSGMTRRFVDRFYQDFRREFTGNYGDEATVFKNDYTDDSQAPAWRPR